MFRSQDRFSSEHVRTVLLEMQKQLLMEHLFGKEKTKRLKTTDTYGWVFAIPKENEQQFYWEHASRKIAIRISFDSVTRIFLGINTFGIRMRHEFFDTALNSKKSVDYIIDNLAKANFDPEFYKKYETEIIKLFKKQSNFINA